MAARVIGGGRYAITQPRLPRDNAPWSVRMATINKLAISGIRSFGQENPEVLE
jgi:hypothetical protein